MAIDFGAILDNTLKAYETVSVARINRDTAKFNSAGVQQNQVLHASEGLTPTEAYNTGNAANPAASDSYVARIPKPLLYGSLGLLGLFLVARAMN